MQHRLTRRTAAIALALVSAGACGGSSEGASADDVPDACTRAAAGFADAPEPVDAPAQERFLSTARSAVREAGSVMRDAAADSTDANLKEMSRLVDAFPQVIGNWTVSEVAWRARATVMRLDELAQEMGLPACGAATWRLPSWVVLTDEAGGTPLPPAEYSAQVAELCASTFGGFASSDEAGTLANALASVNAQRSLDEFSRGIDDHTPPPEHVDEHLEILLVLQSLDAVLPDVPTTLGREKAERVSTLSTRMGEALTSLDAIC